MVRALGEERAVLIAGPTASGKSSLALSLAREAVQAGREPVILNADSMQVYRELHIISARPSSEDEALMPHMLYGFVSAGEAYNTGRWLDDMAAALNTLSNNVLPIIVGGTGLYFKALTEGFAVMPTVPDEVRAELRAQLETHGAEELHASLARLDPQTAASLKPLDSQRILRALEIYTVAGRSIRDFQADAQSNPMLDASTCRKIIALPDRAALYQRIEERFDGMVEAGGLDEVAALQALNLDRSLPAMKAIGVPQFIDHLSGERSIEDAIDNAKQESRRYAKRQMTWMRNQMDDSWERINTFNI
ncbi:MAG: tRNA (adenosine(37)-N6)-dimethylallyltransferase MiaA [Hyphomicrobiales bacterium]